MSRLLEGCNYMFRIDYILYKYGIIRRSTKVNFRQKRVRCPFNYSKKPHLFSVNILQNKWECVTCKKKGGPIEFVQDYYHCHPTHAIRHILNLIGLRHKNYQVLSSDLLRTR